MFICPLCNGLVVIEKPCPSCGYNFLEDKGLLEGYFGPYSPYLDEELLDQVDGVPFALCVHLLACPHCGYDTRWNVPLVDQP